MRGDGATLRKMGFNIWAQVAAKSRRNAKLIDSVKKQAPPTLPGDAIQLSGIARVLSVIDTINDRVGHAFSFLIVPLALITTFEVVARYIFRQPTIWAWDVNMLLFGAIVVIGASYNLLYQGHVKVDVLTSQLSKRKVAVLDLITSPLFFILVVLLLYQTGIEASNSFQKREVMTSIWAPPVYPLKMLIPVGVFLLLLQGIAKFIRDWQIVLRGDIN